LKNEINLVLLVEMTSPKRIKRRVIIDITNKYPKKNNFLTWIFFFMVFFTYLTMCFKEEMKCKQLYF